MKEKENSFNPEANTKTRVEKRAREAEENIEGFFGQASELMKVFKSRQMLRKAGGLIKGYYSEYRKAAKIKSGKEINVELPIDSKIPFEPKALPAYASHIGLIIHGIDFTKKEFGREAQNDVEKFSNDIITLFPEAAEVFKKAQTNIHRSEGGGLGIKTLRALDNEKNACPSLHAEIVALTYSRISDIIDARAENKEDYWAMKEFYFNQAVKILESVLLVKQHAVMDIGVGLGALSGMDKSFSNSRAEKMVNAMFEKESYGMDKQVVSEVRSTILSIYDEISTRISANPKTPIPEVIVQYLKDFNEKKSKEK